MPISFDPSERFRWTHRCKEFTVDWTDPEKGKTRYPLSKMQVGDFFVIEPVGTRIVNAKRAVFRWVCRTKAAWTKLRPDKPYPKFTCRPSRDLPGMYVCRRVR